MKKDLYDIEDVLTEEEEKLYKSKYSKLRKVSILRNLPYEEWTKEELLDLIEEHDFYIMIENSKRKTRYLSISEFATNEKCRFYDLRGSYATKILTNGVEIRDVADILGHRNIETTENYYISSTKV